MMKKIMIPMMLVAFLIAFYEQQKMTSNVYITVGAVAIFMYGMMRLSAKTPSKNQDKNQEDAE
jgi:arginine exporter protein ArgO